MRQYHTVLQDLRYGFRSLFKNPVFTLTAVLSLALGIGANTTIFTVIRSIFLNPLPVHDASTLISLSMSDTKGGQRGSTELPVSYLNLKDFDDKNDTLAALAGFSSPLGFGFARGNAATPARAFMEIVTGNYFDVLGLRPATGRFFLREENVTPGTHPVAVISNAMWQQRFGNDPNIVGETFRLNNIVFTVVGVAPEGFKGVDAIFGPDLWIPVMMAEQVMPIEARNWLHDRNAGVFRIAARLSPAFTPAQAEANLKTIAANLEQQYPESNKGRTVSVQPVMAAALVGGMAKSAVFGGYVLMAIVGLVLIIACSNVANLLMAKSLERQQEIALRQALGAGRGRLIRQLLTENFPLAFLSGICGVAIAYAGVQLLSSLRPAEYAQNLVAPKVDPMVLFFAFLVSLATALIFGIAPALQGSKPDLIGVLKEGGRTAGATRGRVSFANLLLIGQVAFSLIALVTAGLCLRSVQRAYEIDPGFDTRRLAILLTNPGQAGYNQARTEQYYRDVRSRASNAPGVVSLSWSSNMPLWARQPRDLVIPGHEQRDRSTPPTAIVVTVDLNYFETAGIPLLRGRDFTATDGTTSAPVAIVNESMANRYWPGQPAIGQAFRFPGESTLRQIVGVAKTVNYQSLGEAPQPAAYLPLRQNFSDGMILYVRTAGDPTSVLTTLQAELRALDPQIPIEDVRTIRKVIDQALWGAKIGAGLLGLFGFLALGLASIGLYGVMAYSVNRRRREIGVRIALGAERSSVLALVLRRGMQLVGIGIAIGLAASYLVGRAVSTILFGVSPLDPLSIAGASAILMLVAFVACYLPAHRASRLDPIIALRES